MRHSERVPLLSFVGAFLLMTVSVESFAAPVKMSAAKPKGLGYPGTLKSLRVEPSVDGKGVVVRGPAARQQLFVTGVYSSGQLRDLTGTVTYSTTPAGLIHVDRAGLLVPLKDGSGQVLIAGPNGLKARLPVRVEGVAHPLPVNFSNQIVPIFTKLGCSGGGCHGKSGGQNGFKLSLLGFYPNEDYEFLVKEARGRRLFPSAPGQSLLLRKATGRVPHGGGKRMEVGSDAYRVLFTWIEQGMPRGSDLDRHVVGIKCLPEARVMDRSSRQQVTVLATYSDGTTEDVTRMTLYTVNETEIAKIDKFGLLQTLDLAGEVAVMARYQGQVSTFRATIPLGADVSSLPKPNNFIDEAVFGKLRTLGIPASPLCDDATFLRRVSVDITGTTPSEEQVRLFLADKNPRKRDALIDTLVDSPAYADYFANKWSRVLRNRRFLPRRGEEAGTYAFSRWIWSSLYENKPYDQFVREILTASGSSRTDPAVIWYREVDEMHEQVEDAAQLFLGLRIQCARCHHHPYEKWSQDDYYGFAAFFSRLGRKGVRADSGISSLAREKRLFHNEGIAKAKNPRSGEYQKPAGLGSKPYEIPADRDPRVRLADWMADKSNPFFAKALVNRYWKHFFSRAIVEPEDDMRVTNPPSNPKLLDALATNFIQSGFDRKWLVRTICRSKSYQLSSRPNTYNLKDKQNFSRYYPKRLQAEVLYDAFHRITGASQGYAGLPAGSQSMQMPDSLNAPYFLKVFGQPQGDTACECERSQEANLAQSLHLLNSIEVQNKVSSASGRANRFAADKKRPTADKIRELYRWVYAREPNAAEIKMATTYIDAHAKNQRNAYQDIVWSLINTKEFLFNH